MVNDAMSFTIGRLYHLISKTGRIFAFVEYRVDPPFGTKEYVLLIRGKSLDVISSGASAASIQRFGHTGCARVRVRASPCTLCDRVFACV